MAWNFPGMGTQRCYSKTLCVVFLLFGLVAPASVYAKDIGASIDVPQGSHVRAFSEKTESRDSLAGTNWI